MHKSATAVDLRPLRHSREAVDVGRVQGRAHCGPHWGAEPVGEQGLQHAVQGEGAGPPARDPGSRTSRTDAEGAAEGTRSVPGGQLQ